MRDAMRRAIRATRHHVFQRIVVTNGTVIQTMETDEKRLPVSQYHGEDLHTFVFHSFSHCTLVRYFIEAFEFVKRVSDNCFTFDSHFGHWHILYSHLDFCV